MIAKYVFDTFEIKSVSFISKLRKQVYNPKPFRSTIAIHFMCEDKEKIKIKTKEKNNGN